ncbi:MAG: dUTP diphosphatase [Synechococcaceae cyanobacterium SM2_3_60]|nr:dUTP diphosphatase [Synechococcaceae cyanobacterium SM2_3_60]
MSAALTVRIQRTADGFALPQRRSAADAGWDCYAAQAITVEPDAVALVSLGFSVEFDPSWAMLVLPRSGLAKHGISLSNSPGLVDASYRGVVSALVINHSPTVYAISRGDRICQVIFVPVPAVTWVETEHLSESERGSGGFGSTGR